MLEKMEAWRKNANFKIEVSASSDHHQADDDSNLGTVERFNDLTFLTI